jgi:hypothetical protein
MKNNILTLVVAFVCSYFITANPASAQRLTFAATTYVSGDNVGVMDPTWLVAADINGDGKPDLISVNGGGTQLTVVTNDGYGDFGSNALINVGGPVVWAVAADVNGDNKPALICANGGFSGTLMVLTNNGAGIFSSNATLTVGLGAGYVTAADINGDHKVDLISADLYSSTLTVYTNNGSGGFGFNATLPAGADPIYVIAADLNGDGRMDLICADEYADTLIVFTNTGTGVFGSNATYNVGSQPVSIAALDINGNGKLALVTANYGFASGNTLTVLTNNGTGVFGSDATLVVGNGPECVIATDINGDGKPDLITANSQDNTMTVLTNNGAGGFGTNTTLWEGENPDCLVAVDINGDGRMDLVSGDKYTGLTTQTQVGFTAYSYAVGNEPYAGVAVTNNTSGNLDLITANSASTTLTLFTNNGDGIFGSNATLQAGSGPAFLATADINGDGRQDIICANDDATTLSIFTNNDTGGFGLNNTLVVGTGPSCVAPIDVNGDGQMSLATTVNGSLLLFANNGSGVFGSGVTLADDNGFVVAADVNGDHRPDLICVSSLNKPNDPDSALLVLTNNGSGGFGSNNLYEVGEGPHSVVAADINGDGKVDLISANYTSSTVTILTNNGYGVFGSNAAYNVGISPISIVAADINGDGSPDLITANFSANSDVSTVTMLTNNGSGIFGAYATITVDRQPDGNVEPTYITAADLNHDGKPDLIITSLTGTMTVLINTIAFPTSLPMTLKLGATFSGPNDLVLSWSSSATNIVVQTNANLTGPWGTASYPITDANGTNHSVTLTPPPGNLFFRLKQ